MKVLDKNFISEITSKEINDAVKNISKHLNKDYKDKNPLFIILMDGAFVFASDLLRMIKFPCQTEFIKCKSYTSIK